MWQQNEMYPMATANSFLFKSTVYKSGRLSKASQSARDSSAAILSQNPKPKLLTNRDSKTIKVSLVFQNVSVCVNTYRDSSLYLLSEQDETLSDVL